MKYLQKVGLPLLILGGLLLLAVFIRFNPPEAPKRAGVGGPQMIVETLALDRQAYTVRLGSYGTVQPRTKSTLVAQVSGQIVSINPNVRDGGFFEKGDVLLGIDPRDYQADVQIASAALMDARQAVVEAEARTAQAREDWVRLGNSGEAGDLVLRLPQLEAAKARLVSAESALKKNELDLERTQIRAPFAGRVLRKLVDIGQVVTPNTQLADVYATDSVEIRLPIRNRDLAFIDLPEAYRYSTNSARDNASVEIISELGGNSIWEAQLVRTEGAIDESARQLHVIAMITDPFGQPVDDRVPLKIGQYVTAKLNGKTLDNALVIPNNTIYQGSYVYVVVDGVLQRRDIDIAWQNDSEAVILAGLEAGDALVTTALGQVTSGIRVAVSGDTPARGGPGNGASGKPKDSNKAP